MILTFAITAGVGIIVGLLSGMLGVGGGTIMVPLFRLLFGMTAVGSTATSLFTIIPTSVSGALSHLRGKTCLPKLGVVLGIGGACTSPVGAWLAHVSPSWAVMFAAAIAIGYSAFTMLRKAIMLPKAAAAEQQDLPPSDQQALAFPEIDLSAPTMVKAACIGLVTGLLSGYIGLGGGFLMVPLMLSLLHVPMKVASGTSLIGIMILALPATIMQCVLGNVDYLVGIAMACGSIPGAIAGARLAARMPERALRLLFAAFLGVATVLLVLNEFGLL